MESSRPLLTCYHINPFLLRNLSTRSVLILDFSGLLVFFDLSSRLSKLFLETSGTSGCKSNVSVPLLSPAGILPSVFGNAATEPLAGGAGFDFPRARTNFFKCLMNSGYSSRLQCPPPFIHRGSYFTLQSSESCLPWEQSTTSSAVPYYSNDLFSNIHPMQK